MHPTHICLSLPSASPPTIEFLPFTLRAYAFAHSPQQDKVTLKLFQTVVQAGKLERGLDLLDRLHLEKSYDIAATIAGRHDKLVDMIEAARDDKFADPEDDDVSDYGSQSMASAAATTTTTAKTAHVSPISDAKRLFEYSSNPMQSNKKQRRGIF
mmetsp:Transcript_5506/g.14933  ORF Transcript_5506/g.14933 Transcript_5506/m.14933 type:complete len:155 (-) Transcript_5506:1612-2076(-)